MLVICPGCDKKLQVKEELTGKRVKCPRCGKSLAIPSTLMAAPKGQPTLKLDPEQKSAEPVKPSLSGEVTGGSSSGTHQDTLTLGPGDASRPRPDSAEARSQEAHHQELIDFLAAPQQPGELGRLGAYRILRVLGAGGMGVVFQAEDPHLERHVGLKMMKPALASSEAARKRFLREAKATAAIKHDHIVTIYQVGEERSVPFLAMEFLEGEPLDERLKRDNVLPVKEVLRIGREIAEGLSAAHERGLIHRDIKPGNIWLERKRGRVKILDFGLARAMDDETHLTQTGAIVGTPAYMAPEQAQGEPIDVRCDLFSLGGVLYRMCTGKAPFKGANTMSLLMSLARDTPQAPSELNATVPAALSDLIMRLLAKNPAERPATAEAAAEAIRAMENDQTVMLPAEPATSSERISSVIFSPPRKRSRKLPLALAAGSLAAVIVAGVVITFRNQHGTLVVNLLEPDVRVFVDGTEKLVVDSKKVGPVELIPGEHKLMVKRGAEELFTESFTLKSGGEVVIDATWTRRVTPDVKTAVTPGKINASLDAEEQVKAVVAKLKELNPGFDGKVTHKIEGGVVTNLEFVTDHVTDISPVRTLQGLTVLKCNGSDSGKPGITGRGQLADLSPLKGMKLVELRCGGTKVSDLSPLQGMMLRTLFCNNTSVSSLAPLTGMRLTELNCSFTKVSNLVPVKDMKLTYLVCSSTPISSLAPLAGMQLIHLNCGGTKVSDLSPLKDMKLLRFWCYFTAVTDLTPIKDMKLSVLNCGNTQIADLTPLQDMKLSTLMIPRTPVSSLSPLKGMNLLKLHCEQTKVTDLSVLKDMPLADFNCDPKLAKSQATLLGSMKSLTLINGKAAAEFWKEVALNSPAQEQLKTVVARLKDLNPGFDGKVTHDVQGGVVTTLEILTDQVKDISPVRMLSGLTILKCNGSNSGKPGITGQLADLSPLKGMKLVELRCGWTKISDLSPLAGMKLHTLFCNNTPVSSLAPLAGMKLVSLNCGETKISDLSPLRDMNLNYLGCYGTPVADLAPLKNMKLTVLHCGRTQIHDLSPLKDMKLLDLSCPFTKVADLTPLKGMKLNVLACNNTSVSDLAPLAGMKLTVLRCSGTTVSNLSLLKGMPLQELACNANVLERHIALVRTIKTLKVINGKAAAEFWKEVAQTDAAEEQVKAVTAKLKELNPGFDGKVTHKIAGGVATTLEFLTDQVTDISPVQALTGLTVLRCNGSDGGKPNGPGTGQLADLSPLKGMKLVELRCGWTKVSDLSPLAGMKLHTLYCNNTPVSSLAPLAGMKLASLNCGLTKVPDLSPLKDMDLKQLWCHATPVSDLAPLENMKLSLLHCGSTKVADLGPLRQMKLNVLVCAYTPVSDLTPLKDMKLLQLFCQQTKVSDLSIVRDMPLKNLACDPGMAQRHAALLRSMKTLTTINAKPAAEFWKEVEAKQPAKKAADGK
jgi:serine/threonine protein kinase/Leucine-rich repeat (LRR) protein